MFTGLVEATGKVTKISRREDITRLTVTAPFCGEISRGDSICVSGVCTTVVELDTATFTVELTEETMRVSRFERIGLGALVNLERALPATGRLDGHIVAGHVDGTGTVVSLRKGKAAAELRVSVPEETARYIVYKGSICVDGISLTVASVAGNEFSVAVIPETLSCTTLGSLAAGDMVNIETDIIARYVEKFMGLAPAESGSSSKQPLTLERLAEMGW